MPIVSGKYVNPGWLNKTVPAINATNLNDISDALEKCSTAIEIGTYQGDGNYGSSHPTTINFNGSPIMVWIYQSAVGVGSTGYPGILISPIFTSGAPYIYRPYDGEIEALTGGISGSTLTMYSTQGALNQFNGNQYEYTYIAIYDTTVSS